MKQSLGLFLFLLVFETHAATTQLILRGVVPTSYSVSEDKSHKPVVNSNQPTTGEKLPEINFVKGKKFYMITIVQP